MKMKTRMKTTYKGKRHDANGKGKQQKAKGGLSYLREIASEFVLSSHTSSTTSGSFPNSDSSTMIP